MSSKMNIEQRNAIKLTKNKQNIYNFIKTTFDEYDWDRALNYGHLPDDLGCETYNKFLKIQKKEVVNLNDEKELMALNLIHLINNVGISHFDKESMGTFQTSGFIIVNGRFCTFNEQ